MILESKIKLAYYQLNSIHHKITTSYMDLLDIIDEAQEFKRIFTDQLRDKIAEWGPLFMESMGTLFTQMKQVEEYTVLEFSNLLSFGGRRLSKPKLFPTESCEFQDDNIDERNFEQVQLDEYDGDKSQDEQEKEKEKVDVKKSTFFKKKNLEIDTFLSVSRCST